MTEYAPGTVAVATVRGVEGVRVFRLRSGWWTTGAPVHGDTWHGHDEVTDIRPLVVLDLDLSAAHTFAGWLRGHTVPGFRTTGADIADQIEAQTKPPRIPEPGLWGIVEAGVPGIPVRRWVHHEEGWWISDRGDRRYWRELLDPQPVREGVDS